MALSIMYWARYVESHTKLTRKSEKAVDSDRVLKFVLDKEFRVITAVVQASMRDTSYKVQIFLENEENSTGTIKSSTCECPMGQFRCHHVAAALLFGYKRASKTDVRCSWIKHPKSAPPKAITTMGEMYPPRQDYRALKREMTDADRSYLYDQLGHLGRFTALHWILSNEPECEEMPVLLIEDKLISEEYLNVQCKSSYLREKLVICSEKIIETAWLTTGQRENSFWAAVRKLRITASNFGQVIGAIRRNRLSVSLKKRLLSAYNLEKRASIQWGRTHEKSAKDDYCKLSEVSILETGIWLHESGVLGASPDGFVQGDPKHLKVHLQGKVSASPDIIEVKCPFSARAMSIKDACTNLKNFFLECDSEGVLHLRENHDYWHQVQGQLYLTGTTCCDFVVWTPVSMEVIRILRDEFWEIHLKNMIEFYFNVFLPSLQ
ncbi:uncharacterized protein LOC133178631 [Saccostrea echinata]|uniref:uncharacterized protein LOC133178631 n=1 Tax=Saccostrea echinata TaxID=191078 RepID=UPI002A83C41A|nr:uncharacterized protein LOC133178631 [Saccostrea echinata]